MLRRLLPILVLATAFLAIVGCMPVQSSASATTKTEATLNFANDDRLQEHWQKHGKEWGNITRDEYLAKARAFFALPAEKLQSLKEKDGDTVYYRKETNEFGVLSDRKVIRTFFRPRDGQRYFERQRGR